MFLDRSLFVPKVCLPVSPKCNTCLNCAQRLCPAASPGRSLVKTQGKQKKNVKRIKTWVLCGREYTSKPHQHDKYILAIDEVVPFQKRCIRQKTCQSGINTIRGTMLNNVSSIREMLLHEPGIVILFYKISRGGSFSVINFYYNIE